MTADEYVNRMNANFSAGRLAALREVREMMIDRRRMLEGDDSDLAFDRACEAQYCEAQYIENAIDAMIAKEVAK